MQAEQPLYRFIQPPCEGYIPPVLPLGFGWRRDQRPREGCPTFGPPPGYLEARSLACFEAPKAISIGESSALTFATVELNSMVFSWRPGLVPFFWRRVHHSPFGKHRSNGTKNKPNSASHLLGSDFSKQHSGAELPILRRREAWPSWPQLWRQLQPLSLELQAGSALAFQRRRGVVFVPWRCMRMR